MSKPGFIVFSIILFSITVPAQQVLVHQFFPMGINGDIYGDTLINKREILVKEGIRKINIRQSPQIVNSSFASKTYILDQNGNIKSSQYCLYNPKSDSTYCLNDIFWYASGSQKYEMKMYDSKEILYCQSTAEWLDKNTLKNSSTILVKGVSGDSLLDYKYYNEKGQLTKLTQVRKAQEPVNSLYYYNNDGLLDSVSYSNPHLKTTIFSRKRQKSNKVIELEIPNGKYIWVYNSSGQCIQVLYETKNQAPVSNSQPYLFGNPKTKHKPKTVALFYYNSNGTLSKITEMQENGKELNVIYSYE